MTRRSAFLTDLAVLLTAVIALAVILLAVSVGLARLGITPGVVAPTPGALPPVESQQAGPGAGSLGPPAAGAPQAAGLQPAPAAADGRPPAAEAEPDSAQPAATAAPSGPSEPGGQRGAGGIPPGDGTPRFPGERTPPAEMAQAEETPGPAATPISTDAQTHSASVEGEVRSIAVAGAQGVDLYDRPQGTVHAALPAGAVLTALGRSEDGSWLLVQTGDAAGWAEAARLVIFDTAALPVLPASDQPVTAQAALGASAVAPGPETGPTPGAATPAPAPEAAAITAVVTTDDSRLNVRAGPGSSYSIVAKANPGDQFTALARSRDNAWIQVALPGTSGDFGWVSVEFVELSAPLTDLPISDEAGAAAADAPSASQPAAIAAAGAEQTAALLSSGLGPSDGLSGTLVFEESNGGTIYAYDLETGALLPLTYGFDPAVSPDGGTVAFTRDGGENGLYLIDSDGANQRLIYSGRQRLASPKWSPDGGNIVFSRGDEVLRCYMMGPGGCIPEEGADDITGPDGKKIKLDPETLVTQISYMLSVVDTNGNGFHDLPTLSSARAPDWNEAGVVYQSDAGLQITADIPNFENRLVIFNYLKPFFHDPDWQPRPDGSGGAIVYQGKEASHWEIFTVNPDGSGKTALTRPATTLVDELPSNVSPAWSPDGESIVFLSNRSEGGSAGPWRLWVMDADGANQRPLPIDIPITYTFGDEQMVSWAR